MARLVHLDGSPCSDECIKNEHYGKMPDFPEETETSVTPNKDNRQSVDDITPEIDTIPSFITSTTEQNTDVTPNRDIAKAVASTSGSTDQNNPQPTDHPEGDTVSLPTHEPNPMRTTQETP